jgi:guanylate kinase
VFLLPPSREELVRRLIGRGTDSPDAIARRLAAVDDELRAVHAFDYAIVNDDVERATRAMLEIIAAERAGDTAAVRARWDRARVVTSLARVLPIPAR